MSFIFAFSPLAIHYSQEGRPYSLLLCMNTLMILFYIRALKYDASEKPAVRLFNWIGFGFFTLLSCLTHLTTIHVILGLGISVIVRFLFSNSFHIQRKKALVDAAIFSGITFLSSVLGSLWIFKKTFNHYSWLASAPDPDGIIHFLRTVFISMGPAVSYPFVGQKIDNLDLISMLILCLSIGGVCFLFKKKNQSFSLLFSFLTSLLFIYLTLGEKTNWQWIRYISNAQIFYLIFIALGLESFLRFRFGYQKLIIFIVGITIGISGCMYRFKDVRKASSICGHSAENSGIIEMLAEYINKEPIQVNGIIYDLQRYHHRMIFQVIRYINEDKKNIPSYVGKEIDSYLFGYFTIEYENGFLDSMKMPFVSHDKKIFDFDRGIYSVIGVNAILEKPIECEDYFGANTVELSSNYTIDNTIRSFYKTCKIL